MSPCTAALMLTSCSHTHSAADLALRPKAVGCSRGVDRAHAHDQVQAGGDDDGDDDDEEEEEEASLGDDDDEEEEEDDEDEGEEMMEETASVCTYICILTLTLTLTLTITITITLTLTLTLTVEDSQARHASLRVEHHPSQPHVRLVRGWRLCIHACMHAHI